MMRQPIDELLNTHIWCARERQPMHARKRQTREVQASSY
jgi:hypothetical protein